MQETNHDGETIAARVRLRHPTRRPYRAPALASLFLACVASCAGGDGELSSSPSAVPMARGIYVEPGQPLAFLDEARREAFMRGSAVHARRFDPASGLGPNFNTGACVDCHSDPSPGGGSGRSHDFFLTGQRLTETDFVPTGEAGVYVARSLGRAAPALLDPKTNVTARRHPMPFYGAGLMAELRDEDILANADPDDEDGDGISGRANYEGGRVGRFGRKAQVAAIEGFVRSLLQHQMGITTNPLSYTQAQRLALPEPEPLSDSEEGCSAPEGCNEVARVGVVELAQTGLPDLPNLDDDAAADPEMSTDDLHDLLAFVLFMGVPEPSAPASDEGESVFERVGCGDCHLPTLVGPRGGLPIFSDLLLHDMGEEMADGVPMLAATDSEFRTQPLWGLDPSGPFLHDGRADTLEAAIEWHGGEGRRAREAFEQLDEDAREALLAFLRGLGKGSEEPPEPALVAQPEGLSASDLERFDRGRTLFSMRWGYDDGLGPAYDADACSACHRQPYAGGAGLPETEVVRFVSETDDDMRDLPRFSAWPEGPPEVPDVASGFEAFSAPSLLGASAAVRADADAVLELADPDDVDEDGIRGRAKVLSSGELGRLGWRADAATLEASVAHELSRHMGISVPTEHSPAWTASHADQGAAEEPECSEEQLGALAFFVRKLRAERPADPEAEGADEFVEAGCAKCHVPELASIEGSTIRIFSDLLLHDVDTGPTSHVAEQDGERGYRTPPLLDVGQTPPYLHDGRAHSLEDAIAAHGAEASDSAAAYASFEKAQRSRLLRYLESL